MKKKKKVSLSPPCHQKKKKNLYTILRLKHSFSFYSYSCCSEKLLLCNHNSNCAILNSNSDILIVIPCKTHFGCKSEWIKWTKLKMQQLCSLVRPLVKMKAKHSADQHSPSCMCIIRYSLKKWKNNKKIKKIQKNKIKQKNHLGLPKFGKCWLKQSWVRQVHTTGLLRISNRLMFGKWYVQTQKPPRLNFCFFLYLETEGELQVKKLLLSAIKLYYFGLYVMAAYCIHFYGNRLPN